MSGRTKTIAALAIVILCGLSAAMGVVYGIAAQRFGKFPAGLAQELYDRFLSDPHKGWSIAIYTGDAPFSLTDPPHIDNPIFGGADVTDVDAVFVADPFMLIEDGKYTMFFEVLVRNNVQGDIGYAESADGINWEYRKIVIDEDFHLSYPYVFKWEGDYYLMPESNEDLSVRLYKATSFPADWEYVGNILQGHHFIDPAIFRHNDRWWLFASVPGNDALNLYFSDDLLTGWQPHPTNPVVKNNAHISRGGGRVFAHGEELYRLTQDCDPRYALQVFAVRIAELTPEDYREELIEKPVVKGGASFWNSAGMHHVDPHLVDGKWIAVVDGHRD